MLGCVYESAVMTIDGRSKYVVQFPCNIGGRNIFLKTEVIDSELPLLIGNSSLMASGAVLYIPTKIIEMMGEDIQMELEKSGHYSIEIKKPDGGKFYKKNEEELVLLIEKEEALTKKAVL